VSHIPEREIARVRSETGMGRVQAFHHCRARHILQERAKVERAKAAEAAAQAYANRQNAATTKED
jgi:hypothetical protein